MLCNDRCSLDHHEQLNKINRIDQLHFHNLTSISKHYTNSFTQIYMHLHQQTLSSPNRPVEMIHLYISYYNSTNRDENVSNEDIKSETTKHTSNTDNSQLSNSKLQFNYSILQIIQLFNFSTIRLFNDSTI